MWDKILHPFAVAIAWVWVKIHDLLTMIGFSSGSGVAWVVSIVLVTIVVRILIVPLFLKQIKSSRGMQAMQPELQKLQAKYKGKTDAASRQRMAEESQALYKKHGTSPFASCLPLLVQMPVLFAMYRAFFAVKDLAAGTYSYGGTATDHLGPINQEMAIEIDHSTVLGVPLSSTIRDGVGTLGMAAFVVLVVIMVALQFFSMRVSMTRNMPTATDPNNPMVRSQRSMMYMMPAMFIVSGFFFQMGLLVYMITSAAWALGQSIWTIKVMPTPGSPAYAELVTKRQNAYQSWAREYFTAYEAKRAEASSKDEVDALISSTLTEVQSRAKSAKIAHDFPDTMTQAEILSIYRNLAVQQWDTLPDEFWMRGVRRHAEAAEEKRAQQARREQPRRLSKEQRRKQAAKVEAAREASRTEDAAADAPSGTETSDMEDQRAQRRERASQAGNLSAEEIERRRQARRKSRRNGRKNR